MAATAGLGSLGLVVIATPAHAAGGSYTVTSTGDQDDANPGDGVCLSTAGLCTLRSALAEANRDHGPSTISFAIPGTGPQTITIGSSMSLYDAEGPTTINGYSQPTASVNTDPLVDNAQLRIQITSTAAKTGNGAPTSVTGPDGLDLYSANNIVRGIAFYNLRLAVGIHGVAGNQVVGNFIGTNAAGTYHDTVTNSNTFGVVIDGQGGDNNVIGAPNAADRNLVSGNSGRGIYTNNYIGGNKIQNNIVGLTPNGQGQLANTDHGIDINGGTHQTLIGGTGPMEGNLVSGNDGHGVEISHSPSGTTDGNQIIGNRFGTDPTGNSGPAYAQNGVRYGHEEVHTEDHVSNTVIAYNIIGNTPLGGIKVDSFSAGTVIHDNKIGISANGTSIPAGPYGIQIEEGSHGTVVGPNNIITNNRVGIRLQDGTTDVCNMSGCPTQNNTITQNSIYGNDRLGIDITPFDVVNDSTHTSTTNGGVLAPVLSSATATSVTGQTCASCRVELFIADGTTTDPSQESSYGEGKTYLATGTADGSGNFTIRIPASAASRFVTSTVTDTAANTSEFSRNIVVPASKDLLDDSFTRTVVAGWGAADVGGSYTPASDPSSFAVNGTQGTITVPAAANRQIDALGVSSAAVDLSATMTTDHLPPTGTSSILSLVARRQSATSMYRAGLRVDAAGALYVRAEAGATLLGEQTLGFTYDGSPIRVRTQVTGASPTTIKVKAWPVASTEPSAWTLTVTDSTAGLQQAGTVGIRATSTAASGSLLVTVDDFVVTTVPAPK